MAWSRVQRAMLSAVGTRYAKAVCGGQSHREVRSAGRSTGSSRGWKRQEAAVVTVDRMRRCLMTRRRGGGSGSRGMSSLLALSIYLVSRLMSAAGCTTANSTLSIVCSSPPPPLLRESLSLLTLLDQYLHLTRRSLHEKRTRFARSVTRLLRPPPAPRTSTMSNRSPPPAQMCPCRVQQLLNALATHSPHKMTLPVSAFLRGPEFAELTAGQARFAATPNFMVAWKL